MDGRPFKVGRFAHTLRVRLMREHLGVDVDALYDEHVNDSSPPEPEADDGETWDPSDEQDPNVTQPGVTRIGKTAEGVGIGTMFKDFKDAATQGNCRFFDADKVFIVCSSYPRFCRCDLQRYRNRTAIHRIEAWQYG